MARTMNLAAVKAALASSKTPANLKKGLLKKYGHLLGGFKASMSTLATTVRPNPKKRSAIDKLKKRRLPKEIVPGMRGLLSPTKAQMRRDIESARDDSGRVRLNPGTHTRIRDLVIKRRGAFYEVISSRISSVKKGDMMTETKLIALKRDGYQIWEME